MKTQSNRIMQVPRKPAREYRERFHSQATLDFPPLGIKADQQGCVSASPVLTREVGYGKKAFQSGIIQKVKLLPTREWIITRSDGTEEYVRR